MALLIYYVFFYTYFLTSLFMAYGMFYEHDQKYLDKQNPQIESIFGRKSFSTLMLITIFEHFLGMQTMMVTYIQGRSREVINITVENPKILLTLFLYPLLRATSLYSIWERIRSLLKRTSLGNVLESKILNMDLILGTGVGLEGENLY